MSMMLQRIRENASAWRIALVAGVPAILGLAFAGSAGWLTPQSLTPQTVLEVLKKVDGPHPGFRRNHAKGVCVTGWFEGNGAVSKYSRASLFQPVRSRVTGRFALGGGLPYQPDAPEKVRSLALRIMPDGGNEWRMGINDIPVFLVRNAQDFNGFLLATRPDPVTRKPDMARLGGFLAAHPETKKALGLLKMRAVSSGFADDSYNSLDTFLFVDAGGQTVPVRWAMVPEQPFSAATQAGAGRDYLFDDLTTALAMGPLRWKLVVTLGQAGDPTADPTAAWPSDRTQIDAGTLTLDRAEGEDGGPCTGITFDPLVLPDGITASDDPIPAARSAVYARSFVLRSGEDKPPSAVVVPAAHGGE